MTAEFTAEAQRRGEELVMCDASFAEVKLRDFLNAVKEGQRRTSGACSLCKRQVGAMVLGREGNLLRLRINWHWTTEEAA
jgi:hypothetical protein